MSYTDTISPKKVQESVARGFERLENFRSARLLFLRQYTGQYYDRTSGTVGTEALNLIFNAIRILLPNLVLSFPKHTLVTPYLEAKDYAEMLGLALDQHDKQINIRDLYRRAIVDAIFTIGTIKTGLAAGDTVYAFDDEDAVDAGTIYSEVVDFDNLVVDPNCKEHMFRDARFIGDRITVPRQMLLASGLYNNDLIERLPAAGHPRPDRAYEQSMRNIHPDENAELEDDVEIVELWVPSANAIVTVPGSKEVLFDDYLRIDDYYGVKEGPYSFLTLTPPVPGNPLPVPSVGIWYDLHVLSNRMAKKIIEQAERQKDIVAYKRASGDDAEELKNAADGEAVAVDDPDAVKVLPFGGQQNSNEAHLASLQNWFNMMAGNPNQVGGLGVEAKSATAASLLQNNASIGLEDMKDLVYQFAATEGRRRAWYMHTDPMMNIPLTRRVMQPPFYIQGPQGPIMTQPPMMNDTQVMLTPEARRGEFMDFMFDIQPESMGRRDSRTRFAQAVDFATKIMPAAMSAAQAAMMLGIPFSAKALILRMAKDEGIDWMDEVFYDPEFQMQLMQQMAMGPQVGPSKGQAAPPQQPGNLMGQIMQNGQPSSVMAPQGPQAQDNAQAQGGAQNAQKFLSREAWHSFTAPNPIPTAG